MTDSIQTYCGVHVNVYTSWILYVEYIYLKKTWLKLKFLQFCCWTSLVNFAIQLLIFRLQTFCSVHAIISTSVVIFIIFSLSLWAHLRCALNYWSIIFDTCFLRDIFWHFFFLWIGHIFLFVCFVSFCWCWKQKQPPLYHWRQDLCQGWTLLVSRVCSVLWNKLVWRL